MSAETSLTGWVITGFQTVAALWVWVVIMLLHAVWRSLHGPETDPIRPSGPGIE
jgi:hypothetical protein